MRAQSLRKPRDLDDINARIKPWLLATLSQLRNVLVIFAGRPKVATEASQADPQTELISDFQRAFSSKTSKFEAIELKPLSQDELKGFIEQLSAGGTPQDGDGAQPQGPIIPPEYLPIVHRLTGGRPVFLHLLIDLIKHLHPEPREVLKMLDRYRDLSDPHIVADDDPRLVQARVTIETEIMRAVFFHSPLGGYLSRIALMPKGVNADILYCALGLPVDEGEELLKNLEPLSFVKNYKRLGLAPSRRAEHLPHEDRTFLHDEMYRLLREYRILSEPEINERTVANGLIRNYYEPRIDDLQEKLKAERVPENRIPIRREIQKLQVEQLHYRLVQDVRKGYTEYRQLTNEANRIRAVGFGMRLLDEFLRFYNTPGRKALFEDRGLTRERLTRESVQMWVERFHWWGIYDKELTFARQVLDAPHDFYIDAANDCAIIGNIKALVVRARSMKYRFEPDALNEALDMLDCLPSLDKCSRDETLAARAWPRP